MAQILNKIAVVAAAGVLLAVCVLAVPAQTIPAPERDQLLNGLTILYSNRPGDPDVLLKLRIKSGAAFDLTGKAGTMSLLADAMFPESTIREYVAEQLGGQLDVSTSYDSIDVTISGKSSELERIIELLRNAVINVNLSAENVATLREARLKEISGKQATAAAIADRAVAARLFGTYPYGSAAAGTVESLARIDRADLMLARERFLHADNATLAVIGGVEKARVMRAVRQLLGPWQKSDRIVPATFRQPGSVDDRVLLIDQPEATTVQIRLAVRGLSQSDRDLTAANILSFIAGQRWRAAVPELSTSNVSHEAHALSGMFTFSATVPPASAAKALAAAKNVMKELAASAPSESEMGSSIQMFKGTPAEIASAWLNSETYKVPSSSSGSATQPRPDDIRRVAGRLFENSVPLAIVVTGNAAELQTQLGYKVELRSSVSETKPAPTSTPTPKKP